MKRKKTKDSRGRKPLAGWEPTVRLTICLPESQLRRIRYEAEQQNESTSEYARGALVQRMGQTSPDCP